MIRGERRTAVFEDREEVRIRELLDPPRKIDIHESFTPGRDGGRFAEHDLRLAAHQLERAIRETDDRIDPPQGGAVAGPHRLAFRDAALGEPPHGAPFGIGLPVAAALEENPFPSGGRLDDERIWIEGPDHGALGRFDFLERHPLHPAGNGGVEQRQRGDVLIEHLDAVRGSDEERLCGRDAGGRVGHAHLPVAGECDDHLRSRPGEHRESRGDDGNGKD